LPIVGPVRAPPVSCAVCERTLLDGEHPVRFSPDGRVLVDVCTLCRERALDLGWYPEGGPTLPVVPTERRRQRRGLSALLLGRRETAEPVVAEPILRRLSEPEQAMVEAAELFNTSAFQRTVDGIARSLGTPTVSIVPLSGVNPEVVITICWDISWYQYRVDFDSPQPVRLTERGTDPGEIEGPFADWNAELNEDGFLVPAIERL
jgi:hypothetical protein